MKTSQNILFTAFLLLSVFTKAQQIEGVYQVEDNKILFADIGMTYSFEKDGTFRTTIFEHLGQKIISGGGYELAGDTLTLHYTRLKTKPSNPVKIIKKVKLKTSSDTSFNPMFSEIKVFNSDGKPQPGVHLVLLNKEGKPVMAFGSDSIGNFPDLNIYDEYIKHLQFSFLAHQVAYLKTDSLFNYRTDIEVRLNQSTEVYVNEGRTFRYLINRTEEGMKLIPFDKKQQKILLRKKNER